MDALSAHEVIPLVLWDDTETRDFPASGFALLEDAEGGGVRAVWLRPSQRARWREAVAARRTELERLFLAKGAVPLFIGSDFSPELLGEHFSGAAR
jgi:hypothetical protein